MLKSSKLLLAIALGLSLLLVTGCMPSMNKAPTNLDAEAKGLTPPPGKALVFIVRPTNLGRPMVYPVTCDDKSIGSTQGMLYIYTIQDPGLHKFVSQADNAAELEIALEADKVYFIEQQVTPGLWKGFNTLAPLSQEKGREYLNQCELSADLG